MTKPTTNKLLQELSARYLKDEMVAWDQHDLIAIEKREKIAILPTATNERNELAAWLCAQSSICNIIHSNPASDSMLRIVYPDGQDGDTTTTKGIDHLLSRSLSGQALRDRLQVCSLWLAQNFIHPGKRIIDLGGGSGNYALHAIGLNPTNMDTQFQWDHLDNDKSALEIGRHMANKAKLDAKVTFRDGNFMSEQSFPEKKFDFGVLIGVLCSLDKHTSSVVLKRIHNHFKPGAEILAATLTTQSFAEDPITFRILCNLIGWNLCPKTIPEVANIFSTSGWDVLQIMSERGERPGQYAIVHARMR